MSITQFKTSTFAQLSPEEIFHMMKLRVDVFVVEQKCYYPEIDEWDNHAEVHHLQLLNNNQLAGYARLIPPCDEKQGACSIGRVIIHKDYRGQDLGHQLMQQAITESQRLWPQTTIKISAQHHLQKFYKRLGFELCSAAYLEDGIPHIDMRYS